MTACVKNHSRRVALAVSASLVGALSLGAAPVAAVADDGVETLDVAPNKTWEGVELTWSATADRFGEYTIQTGEQFVLNSATDAFGAPISMSDLTVAYVNSSNSVSAVAPTNTGVYTAVVINGKVDLDTYNTWGSLNSYLTSSGIESATQDFTIAAKSLEGAYAYQGNNVSDTSFKFTGNPITVNFADASGKKLVAGQDYTVKGLGVVQGAGDYVVTLTGINGYSGTVSVKFTVDPLDLENDTFTVAPQQGGGSLFSSGNLIDTTKILVNGEPLASGVVDARITSVIRANGTVVTPATSYSGYDSAKVTLQLTANSSQSSFKNIADLDATGDAEMLVVDQVISSFYYDGELINAVDGLKFETAKGEEFDPALITTALTTGGDDLPVDVTVTKDGETVSEYTEPGVYNVHVEVAVPDTLEYAGTCDFTVTVVSKRYSEQPKVFVSVDGKDVNSYKPEYDGEAVVPVIAAKAGTAVLVEGEDYTVTYKDAEGNAVSEMVEPGTYTGTVDFGDAVVWKNGDYKEVQNVTFTVSIVKATLNSAKADKDVYAWTGDAVSPVFTAWTGKDLDGLSLEIDPAKVGVTYYKAEKQWKGFGESLLDPSDDVYEWVADETSPIKASDLKDEGVYVAELTAPADDPHFSNQESVFSQAFEISKTAGYSDVDAGAWYAEDVYNAKGLGYMTGIAGTDLFMPVADISRAEIAQTLANMAGGVDGAISTPTQFNDVDPYAWYAEAISWASNSGVVTGYQDGSGNFGPNDKASREQVAAMIYRYAKAQGKDMAVEDVDAALAAYTDGDQVSGWAREAMAWCVENGVFGVNTDELNPQMNIQRAQVASIAVRVQPEALK